MSTLDRDAKILHMTWGDLCDKYGTLEQTLIQYQQSNDMSLSFMRRYSEQCGLLRALFAEFNHIVANAQNPYPQLLIGDAQQCLVKLQEYYGGVSAWADMAEQNILHALDQAYAPSTEAQIKINLGTLEFRTHLGSGQVHAIKRSNIKPGQTLLEDPIQEAIFYSFGNKDLYRRMLRLYETKTLREQFIMISPRAVGGDLFKYITQQPQQAKQNAKAIFTQLVYAIHYLHNTMGCAHLDIKPENIFLDQDFLPILGDFGMARIGEFPVHPHNTSQQNADKFYSAFKTCAIFRHTLKKRNIDEVQDGIYPRFSVPYSKFETWRAWIKNNPPDASQHPITPQQQQQLQQQGQTLSYDIAEYVNAVSIGDLTKIGTFLDCEELKKENLLPPPMQYDLNDPKQHLLFLVSPHSRLSSLETLQRLQGLDASLQPHETAQLIASNQFSFKLTHLDYEQAKLALIAQKHGIPLDDYWTQRDRLFQQGDYTPTTVDAFINDAIQFCQLRFGMETGLVAKYLNIEFAPDLPPYIYSWLSEDLSTLAQRPCQRVYGTRAYMCPALANPSSNGPKYDPFKADIYSLGVVFFILVFGFPPYRDPSASDPAYARLIQYANEPLQQGQTRRPIITKLVQDYGRTGTVDQSVTDLLDRMMCFDPMQRITARRIAIELIPRLKL